MKSLTIDTYGCLLVLAQGIAFLILSNDLYTAPQALYLAMVSLNSVFIMLQVRNKVSAVPL